MSLIHSYVLTNDKAGLKKLATSGKKSCGTLMKELDQYGYSPLYTAATVDSVECIYYMLDHMSGKGRSIRRYIVGEQGRSPIIAAYRAGNVESVKTMLHILDDEYLKEVLHTGENSQLYNCSSSKNHTVTEFTKAILNRIHEARDYEFMGEFITTNLAHAVKAKNHSITGMLSRALTSINECEMEIVDEVLLYVDSTGMSILHKAVESGELLIVKHILEAANRRGEVLLLHMRNKEGKTALEMATTGGNMRSQRIAMYITAVVEEAIPMTVQQI